MADKKDSVVVLSNYSWAYLAAAAALKTFPGSDITLVTSNIKDVAKLHDFGMPVIEVAPFRGGGIAGCALLPDVVKKPVHAAVVIDHGFGLSTIAIMSALRFKKLFLVTMDSGRPISEISRARFIRLIARKAPYFLNKLLSLVSMKYRMGMSLGAPSELSVETTSVCNLSCKGCPTGLKQLARPSQPMDEELFSDIIKKNKRSFRYLDLIYPFFYGEPLLNKRIFEYLRVLRKTAFPYTRIELHTNGNIQNAKGIARELVETEVDLISVSIDGTDRASYEGFRAGGNFDLVCEFVKQLAKAKKEAGLVRPEIALQMIITRHSEEKTEQFKRLKKELGADRYIFKGFFHEFTGLTEAQASELLPSKKELALTKEEKDEIINAKNHMCGWPYRSISVTSDGAITPCCIDSKAVTLRGLSARSSTIRKIWNSPAYRRFRKSMMAGAIELCNRCFFS